MRLNLEKKKAKETQESVLYHNLKCKQTWLYNQKAQIVWLDTKQDTTIVVWKKHTPQPKTHSN
jgi:hypothetical protein